MTLFIPQPLTPSHTYLADNESQYRLGVYQVLGRLVILLAQSTLRRSVDVASTYQLTRDDGVVRCDTTSAGFTVTLPPVAMVRGQTVVVKKISTDGNTLTVDGNGAEQIDGSATLAWATGRLAHTLFANGTSWDVVG